MSLSELRLAIVGENPTLLWGIDARERISRIARANNIALIGDACGANLLANAGFAFDPLWLKHIATRPGAALTSAHVPVVAHARSADEATAAALAMAEGSPISGFEEIAIESSPELVNAQLRKRERPFVGRLEPSTVRSLQEASYAGSYKGVTDLLTKYLWPQFAFHLTRLAAKLGLSPNMVTLIGFILCLATIWLFYRGDYWPGMVLGYLMMVLDTVDGKLARCTITSSWWGNVFDHGIDLIHPPFWWAAWALGLARYGTPLPTESLWIGFAAIMAAYVVQRLIEGAFIASFGMHIHVWQKLDSQFRLITARRNPNMAILLLSLAIQHPDWGYLAIAWWGVVSCLVHLVRLGQAWIARTQGRPIASWLDR